MQFNKPNRLKRGDTIAIVSPSFPAVNLFQNRLKRAETFLKSYFDFKIVYAPNASKKTGYVAGSPQERADDINWSFSNTDVNCVMAAIGGLNSNALLPYIDFEIIKKNPKIFIGYSDVTAVHLPITLLGNLVTFYGPALFSEWGEFPQPFLYTINSFEKMTFANTPYGDIEAAGEWTDEFLEWGIGADNRDRKLNKSVEWKIINEGTAEGILFGGNVDTINVLCGTKYFSFPEEDFIFFFEITHLKPPAIDRALEQLVQNGLFKNMKGILFSKYHAYDNSLGGIVHETTENDFEMVELILAEKFKHLDIPIISRMDFGHTDPMFTLPIGVKARIVNNKVTILENACL